MTVIRPEPVLFVVALCCAAPALAQSPPGEDQQRGQHFLVRAEDLPLPPPEPLAYVMNAPQRVARGDRLPLVPDGFTVTVFAENLPHPRRIEVMPDGTVLVVQQGSGEIIALEDADLDGVAESGGVLASGFSGPFGIARIASGEGAGDLLLADVNAVWRIPLSTGGEVTRVTPLNAFGEPAGHITRTLVIDPASGDLIVSVGSMSNLAEEREPKATIQRFAGDGSGQRTFGRGLRNATGLRVNPSAGELYAVVMERDAMGDELVPDYLTRVREGDDFGWPTQYAGGFAQPEFATSGSKRVAADLPDILFTAHSAPMDLVFVPESWPAAYRAGAIVALKGSSNRTIPTGYKLVFVPFGADSRPVGGYQNFATGFWVSTSESGAAEVFGRPAALGLMPDGGLLVADDFAGALFKIMPPAD